MAFLSVSPFCFACSSPNCQPVEYYDFYIVPQCSVQGHKRLKCRDCLPDGGTVFYGSQVINYVGYQINVAQDFQQERKISTCFFCFFLLAQWLMNEIYRACEEISCSALKRFAQ